MRSTPQHHGGPPQSRRVLLPDSSVTIRNVLKGPTQKSNSAANTDRERAYVSETGVYRLLRAGGVLIRPVCIVMNAAERFTNPTTAVNHSLADRLHVSEGPRLGLVLSVGCARRLLAVHRRLQALHNVGELEGAVAAFVAHYSRRPTTKASTT